MAIQPAKDLLNLYARCKDKHAPIEYPPINILSIGIPSATSLWINSDALLHIKSIECFISGALIEIAFLSNQTLLG